MLVLSTTYKLATPTKTDMRKQNKTNKPGVRAGNHSATGCDTERHRLCLTYCVLSKRGLRIRSRVLSCRACDICARRECARARFALWSRASRVPRAQRRASDPLSPTIMLLLLACLCVSQYKQLKLPVLNRYLSFITIDTQQIMEPQTRSKG